MSIEIQLEGNQVVFHPGDVIRGKVVYQLAKSKTIDKVILSLSGLIKTEYIPMQNGNAAILQGPRRPSREKIELFDTQEVVLFQGPYKVPPQTFEWPFELALPKTCSRGSAAAGRGSADTLPPNASGMPANDAVINLPPNYKWRDMLVGRDASAEISYNLSVNVSSGGRLGGLFSGDSYELPLTVRPSLTSPDQSLDLKPTAYDVFPSVSWSSSQLRPAERRLSLRNKMKSTFSSDPTLKTPCLAFTLVVHVPRSLDLHQRFAVSFSVRHERKTENDPDSPTLELCDLSLVLMAHTTMIVGRMGLFQEERVTQGEQILAAHKPQLSTALKLPIEGDMILAAEDLCLADWLGKEVAERPDALLSDFSTWVVKVGHRLAMQATVRHAETEKEFKFATQVPFELRRSGGSGVSQHQAQGGSSAQEQLPRYERDEKPPLEYSE